MFSDQAIASLEYNTSDVASRPEFKKRGGGMRNETLQATSTDIPILGQIVGCTGPPYYAPELKINPSFMVIPSTQFVWHFLHPARVLPNEEWMAYL